MWSPIPSLSILDFYVPCHNGWVTDLSLLPSTSTEPLMWSVRPSSLSRRVRPKNSSNFGPVYKLAVWRSWHLTAVSPLNPCFFWYSCFFLSATISSLQVSFVHALPPPYFNVFVRIFLVNWRFSFSHARQAEALRGASLSVCADIIPYHP